MNMPVTNIIIHPYIYTKLIRYVNKAFGTVYQIKQSYYFIVIILEYNNINNGLNFKKKKM